jgi:hypothetical protein
LGDATGSQSQNSGDWDDFIMDNELEPDYR